MTAAPVPGSAEELSLLLRTHLGNSLAQRARQERLELVRVVAVDNADLIELEVLPKRSPGMVALARDQAHVTWWFGDAAFPVAARDADDVNWSRRLLMSTLLNIPDPPAFTVAGAVVWIGVSPGRRFWARWSREALWVPGSPISPLSVLPAPLEGDGDAEHQ
jgi:hypothetical protein